MKTADSGSYFVRFRGRVSGPFSLERLRSMAYAGQLSPIHEISADRATWTPASDVPGLLPAAPEPAPQPVAQQAAEPAAEERPRDRWYYMDPDGNRVGPVGRRDLLDLHDRGDVDADTPVWSKGMADWVPFDDAGLASRSRRATTRQEEPAATAAATRSLRPGVGFGITAMVCGILSLLSSCLSFIPYAGIVFFGFQLILGIVAICFGAGGMKTQGRGLAIAGLVTGIIGVALFVLLLVIVLVFVGTFAAWGAARGD
jgi:hypothetical protein